MLSKSPRIIREAQELLLEIVRNERRANQLETEEARALIQDFHAALRAIRAEVRKVIVGQDEVVEHLLLTLLVGGHCLITGMPGTAKTLLVRTLGEALGLTFKRIQFTPDLMPTDITGTDIIEEDIDHRPPHAGRSCPGRCSRTCCSRTKSIARRRRRRPRCSRRCRSTRSRCAATHHMLEPPFFVLATQNPIELEGTYPLPEAQLDRFLFNVLLDYLSAEDEVEGRRSQHDAHGHARGRSVHRRRGDPEVSMARAAGAGGRERGRYAVDLVRATRPHDPSATGRRAQVRALRRERARDAVPDARREGARARWRAAIT